MKNKNQVKNKFPCVGYTFSLKNSLNNSFNALFRGYTGGYTRLHKGYTF